MSTPTLKILSICFKEPKPNDMLHQMVADNPCIHPIFCGEGTKLGITKFLDREVYNDNDGEDNISHLNKHISEMSAIYWTWKNYDKIGNPDYIGFCHYRRRFDNNDIVYMMQHPEIQCLAIYHKFQKTFPMSYFILFQETFPSMRLNLLHQLLTDEERSIFFDSFCKLYTDVVPLTNHMFILKRDDFFKYCEWIIPKLFNLYNSIYVNNPNLNNINWHNYFYKDKFGTRYIAYMTELLTIIYLYKNFYYNKPKNTFILKPVIENLSL
jgi:hypothetical protein